MMNQDTNWENPYAGGQEAANAMENLPTKVPHTLGILNIVFAIFLLLCVACYGVQVIAHGLLGSTFAASKQQAQKAMEERRQKDIDALEDSANKAATEEEAESLRAEKEDLENMPLPKIPDMSNMLGMKSPGVFAAYLFDCSTGLILNVLMLISGVGLLKYHAWARKLAMWVAALKILRLLILCALTGLIISPAVSEGMGQFVGEAAQMNPNGGLPQQNQVAQMKTIYYWSTLISGGVLTVLGVIYPIISLWLLSRPNVAAACQKKQISPNTF